VVKKGEAEYALRMGLEHCSVGFAGKSGILDIVEIRASTVFEAAARALARFQSHAWLKSELSLGTLLVVHVPAGDREYRVQVRRLLAWFDEPGRDRVHRYQLKLLLTRQQTSPRVNARIRAHQDARSAQRAGFAAAHPGRAGHRHTMPRLRRVPHDRTGRAPATMGVQRVRLAMAKR
jgi:hypothetical protein